MSLRSRIVPCLLMDRGRLIKTRKFKEDKYIGDPINAVRIFNEKSVDELMILDISATRDGKSPDYTLLQRIARESRMPLCYGGGVKTSDQARELVKMGFEKIAVSSAFIDNKAILKDISRAVGQQSVVAVFDVKRSLLGRYEAFTHNGMKKVKEKLEVLVKSVEELGVGEIVVNSIDKDGEMSGYDLSLAHLFREWFSGPLTVLGGAGSKEDFARLENELGVVGAAAGSYFVYKGRYRAVLINYLAEQERVAMGMRR